ncbi:MAG: proton-conducting membrane transporter [Oscillospiraceae bacterium]|nr:proton-conducting membrane transporter [Oscillospiraceae bacterium]
MLLLFAALIPLLGAIWAFRDKDVKRVHRVTAACVIAGALLASAAALTGAEDFTLLRLSDTLTLRFGVDGLSVFFILLVSLIWCVVQFHAFGYMKHEGAEGQFFGFYMLTYGTLILLASARNAVTLYMCFEFMTLCSMPMVLHNGTESSRAAAFKYLGYSTLGALLALMGFFLLAAAGNSLEFVPGGAKLAGNPKTVLIAAFLCVFGFGAKAGLVPLQMWLTEAHPVAPSPASAVLSGLITKGGVIAILRTVFWLFGAELLKGTWVQTAIQILAIVTIFTGSMLALGEKLLKKRLAYSTVSNVSYVLFGLFSFTAAGFAGAFLQVLAHALAKDALFLCAGNVIFATGHTKVAELKGVGRRMPVTMLCFTAAALSLIGIPPLAGFTAKWYLAVGALEAGAAINTVGVVMLMVSAFLTAFYLLPIVADAFFPGRDYVAEEPCEVALTMRVPVIVFAVLTALVGMFPARILDFLSALSGGLL